MSEWTDIAPVKEFGPGQAKLFNIAGVDIAVFNLTGQYYAIEDVCSHEGSPMLGCGLAPEDVVDGDQIICPRHGARFCIRTGAALTPPAYEPLVTFPVKIANGMVQIRDNRPD